MPEVSHVVPYTSGVADYIEETVPHLFAPPFREGDVFVESASCKSPNLSYGEGERERKALEDERERLALEDERERLAQAGVGAQ